MIDYIERLRKEVPMVSPSKKPTSKLPNLSNIIGEPRKLKNDTSSLIDLHEYLEKKIQKMIITNQKNLKKKLLKIWKNI